MPGAHVPGLMYLAWCAIIPTFAFSACQGINHAIQVLLPPFRVPGPPHKRLDHELCGLSIDLAVLFVPPRPFRHTDSFSYGRFFVFVAVQVAPLTFTTPATVRSKVLTEMCVALSTCDFLPADVAHSVATVAYKLVAAA